MLSAQVRQSDSVVRVDEGLSHLSGSMGLREESSTLSRANSAHGAPRSIASAGGGSIAKTSQLRALRIPGGGGGGGPPGSRGGRRSPLEVLGQQRGAGDEAPYILRSGFKLPRGGAGAGVMASLSQSSIASNSIVSDFNFRE